MAEKKGDTKKTDEKKSSSSSSKKSIADVAAEVRNGEWGEGQERRQRLSDAGYNPNEVKAEITRLLNQ